MQGPDNRAIVRILRTNPPVNIYIKLSSSADNAATAPPLGLHLNIMSSIRYAPNRNELRSGAYLISSVVKIIASNIAMCASKWNFLRYVQIR